MRSRAHKVMQNTGLEAEVDKKPFWAADKLLIWETELLSFTVDSFNCQNASKRCLKRKCAAHNCYNAGTREQRNHGTKTEENKDIMTIKYRITKCESTVLWCQDSAKTHIIRLMPSQQRLCLFCISCSADFLQVRYFLPAVTWTDTLTEQN